MSEITIQSFQRYVIVRLGKRFRTVPNKQNAVSQARAIARAIRSLGMSASAENDIITVSQA
jgi:hypothetical protein